MSARPISTTWCDDERHDVPCPADYCNACREECEGPVVDLQEIQLRYPELSYSWFDEMSR